MSSQARVGVTALLCWACVLWPVIGSATERCEPVLAELTRVQGNVRLLTPESPFPARVPALPVALCAGDQVHTLAGGRAQIEFGDDQVVVAEQAILNVRDATKAELLSGVALFDVTPRAGQRLQATTPLMVIGVKGTRFLVSAGDQRHDIALFQGDVDVARQDGAEMAYYAAEEAGPASFQNFLQQQRQAFRSYREAFQQSFDDYKTQQNAQFQAFVQQVELAPGRQLTLAVGDAPDAVEADIGSTLVRLERDLSAWQRRR